MISFILSLFKKIPTKTYLYLALFLMPFFIIIFSYNIGYNNAKIKFANQIKTEQIVEYKDRLQTITKEVEVAKEKEKKIYITDLQKVRKLENENEILINKILALKDKVEEYVPEKNVGGFLSVGALSLLNKAAEPNSTNDNSIESQAATLAAIDNTAPSTVSWRQFTRAEIELRGKYNRARNQCNALIEWVELNIVNDTAIDK